MEKKIYLTSEGYNKLKDELENLLNTERKAVAARIKTAREQGDLSENSEYDDAKERQAFVEGRILEIEHILKNAEIIDEKKVSCDVINVGCTVHLSAEKGDLKYRIVGSTEADPEKGYISNESPLGQALLGKKKGEEIEVQVPAGKMKYKIKDVK